MAEGATATKKQSLEDVVGAVNKEFGAGTLKYAGDVAFAYKRRVSTGIFALDAATGGGIPRGRVTLLVGELSTGKSTICLNIAAQFQKTCRMCHEYVTACACGKGKTPTPGMVAYVDAEGTFDEGWAAKHGVDTKKLLLVQTETAQQGADIINKMMRTGELDCVIVDSIATLTPSREVESSAEAGQRPDLALAMNRLMRTLQSSLNSLGMDNEQKPAVILVNQHRQKIGVMYGSDVVLPGGKGQGFAASIEITVRGGKAIDIKGAVGGKDTRKIGTELHFKITKNKTYPPFKAGTYKLFYEDCAEFGVTAGSINNFEQLVEYGILHGVADKRGAYLDLQDTLGKAFANPNVKSGMFQGVDALIGFLMNAPKLSTIFRKAVLDKVRTMDATPGAGVASDPDED